ncbi:MAG: response regulator transcription factor [Candidatus Obscuribacterales bacterium]|nr:response regulator transcription factor [Candidatus Obscuribacterales bacterium]
MARILVVEDDQSVVTTIIDTLEKENHTVESLADGREALSLLKIKKFDLVLLDWNLPGANGITICRQIRSGRDTTPVMMLTGMSDLSDKESGLDSGADDYLTKPFQPRELAARVRSLLRRSSGSVSNVLEVGDLVLDVKSARTMRKGKVVKLTNLELALLEFLMRHKGQVFSAEALLARVWNDDSESTTESVRQCVRRLRQKLDIEGLPSAISNLPGLGYKVEDS